MARALRSLALVGWLLSGTSLLGAERAQASGVVWPNLLERVAEDLASRDVERRRNAALELERLPPASAAPLVTQALQDPDERVRVSAARAAIATQLQSAVELVSSWLTDKDVNLRHAAVLVLEAFPHSERAVERLGRALVDPEPRVRRHAARALAATADPAATSALLSRIDDANPDVSIAIVDALELLGDSRSVVPLIGRLSDNRVAIRRAAARALGTLGGQAALSALLVALRDSDAQVRLAVVAALGAARADGATASLVGLLQEDGDVDVRVAALHALAAIGTEAATAALIAALASPRDEISTEARRALTELPQERAALLQRCLDNAPTSSAKADGCAAALVGYSAPNTFESLTRAFRDRRISPQTALGALGALGDPRAVPTVLEQLSASDAAVRLAAVDAALQLLDPKKPDGRAVEPILRALQAGDRATEERIAVLLLLGRTGAPRAAVHLEPFVAEHNPRRVRLAALRALGDVGVDTAALDAVLAALASPDAALRLEAARALRTSRRAELLPPLMALTTAAGQDRAAVISALMGPLSTAATAAHIEALRQLAAASEPSLVAAIIEALAVVSRPEATEALLALSKGGRDARAKVAEALAVHGHRLESPKARAEIAAVLNVMATEPDAVVRANAVWALGELRSEGSAKLLTAASSDPDAAVAANATGALSRLARSEASQARICAALVDDRAYVRANALVALRAWGVRCSGGVELELLRSDPSPVARAAAARLLRQVAEPARAAQEIKALEHCARTEPSGRVASACAGSTPPAVSPGATQEALPSTVFIVPAGYTTPVAAAPFALSSGDGVALRVGLADVRGAILVAARAEQVLRLEPPPGTDTP